MGNISKSVIGQNLSLLIQSGAVKGIRKLLFLTFSYEEKRISLSCYGRLSPPPSSSNIRLTQR